MKNETRRQTLISRGKNKLNFILAGIKKEIFGIINHTPIHLVIS